MDLYLGAKSLSYKWDFKKKLMTDGSTEKFKDRSVIIGFTIQYLLSSSEDHQHACRPSLNLQADGCKDNILHGELNKDLYISVGRVCRPRTRIQGLKLTRSLYGLKQVPKLWHAHFDQVVLSNGFVINDADKCVYHHFADVRVII